MQNPWRESANVLLLRPITSPQTDPTLCDYEMLTISGDTTRGIRSASYVTPGGPLHASDLSPKWWALFERLGVQTTSFGRLSPDGSAARPPIICDNLFVDDLRRGSSNTEEDFVTIDMALRIAAIRHIFTQTGILVVDSMSPKSHVNPDVLCEWRERVGHSPDQFHALCQRYDLKPDLWSLKEWWNWLTPVTIGRTNRFDTIYYLCVLQSRHSLTTGATHHWSAPVALLTDRYTDGYTLSPPQVYELCRLLNYSSVKDLEVFAAQREREGCHRWLPSLAMYTDGAISTLPGDDLYPETVELFVRKPIKTYGQSVREIRAKSQRLNRMELSGIDCEVVSHNSAQPCGHIAPVSQYLTLDSTLSAAKL